MHGQEIRRIFELGGDCEFMTIITYLRGEIAKRRLDAAAEDPEALRATRP